MQKPKQNSHLSLVRLDETAKRQLWFEEQQQQFQKDAARRDKRLRMQQLVQIAVSLHIAIIIGMLVSGIVIITRLAFMGVSMTDPDTQNYIIYVKIYIGVFIVNAGMYLIYAGIRKKQNA